MGLPDVGSTGHLRRTYCTSDKDCHQYLWKERERERNTVLMHRHLSSRQAVRSTSDHWFCRNKECWLHWPRRNQRCDYVLLLAPLKANPPSLLSDLRIFEIPLQPHVLWLEMLPSYPGLAVRFGLGSALCRLFCQSLHLLTPALLWNQWQDLWIFCLDILCPIV